MDICVVKKKAKLYGLAKGKVAGFADGRASGFADGKASGFADGKSTGITEEKFRIAKSMKKSGIDIREISKFTGLSLKELENL